MKTLLEKGKIGSTQQSLAHINNEILLYFIINKGVVTTLPWLLSKFLGCTDFPL